MSEDLVLAAVGLGAESESVLRAARFWGTAGAKVLACHVLPDLRLSRPLFPQLTGGDATFALDLQQRVGEHLSQLAARALPNAEVTLESGEPYARIVALAAERRASLIVVGPPTRSDRWFATTSERIVRYAPCSVLVHRGEREGPVLAATDLSDPSLPALAAGARAATQSGKSLIALHVIDVDSSLQALSLIAAAVAASVPSVIDHAMLHRRATEALDEAMRKTAPDATPDLAVGDPSAQIARRAAELGASLVVVGTHGRTGLDRVFVGSVAEAVVRDAPCSVLVVRHSP